MSPHEDVLKIVVWYDRLLPKETGSREKMTDINIVEKPYFCIDAFFYTIYFFIL